MESIIQATVWTLELLDEATKFTNSKPFVSNFVGLLHSSHLDWPYIQRSYMTNHLASDFHSRTYSSILACKSINEKDVTFGLLCSKFRVGSLLGQSGTIIQALQNETGATIRVEDATCDSDERIVKISSLENIQMKDFNAQDEVFRVHSRTAEEFERGSHVNMPRKITRLFRSLTDVAFNLFTHKAPLLIGFDFLLMGDAMLEN